MQTAPPALKLCVIGAGVIGSATAHALASAGHQVVLLEAAAAPGTVGSFANGAQLRYSQVEPLGSPALRRALPSLLRHPESPVSVHWHGGWTQLAWTLKFLHASRTAQAQRASRALMALSLLSRDELRAQQGRAPLSFLLDTPGHLAVLTDADQLDAAAHRVAWQRPLGSEQVLLRPAECLAQEPALAALQTRLLGGVWSPGDQVGDARLLSQALVARLPALGAQVRTLTRATGFSLQGERITAVHTHSGDVPCDGVVLANGIAAAPLALTLGLRLPLCPVKGHSITLPLRDAARAPAVSITDVAGRITFTRLGDHLRVAGFDDLVGADLRPAPDRIRRLVQAAREAFPGSCEFTADPHAWAGLRCATPGSLPLIGPTRWRNLWLNVGHGGLGFTLAMGSARLVERWIAGDVQAGLAAPFVLAR